jgi:hypothetical protein
MRSPSAGRVFRRLAFAAALIAAPAHAGGAQARWRTLDDFLTNGVRLTDAQQAVLTRGDAVVRLLPTANRQDVAVLGAVQVDVPRAFFIDLQRDPSSLLRTPRRLDAGLFSDPPVAADLQAIEIPSGDLKELRSCRPGECNMKLPLAAMEYFRNTIDRSAPDARARASAYYRQWIVDYVNEYRRRGNAAMVVYDDEGGARPLDATEGGIRASDALEILLRDSSYVSGLPSLERWFLDYPQGSPAGARERFYWARDDLPHLRRVFRVEHQMIYEPPEMPSLTIVAAKQIYANHYFEAGLEVLAAGDRSAPAAEAGITLVGVRRYRFDNMPSGGLFNIRGRVVNGLRDNLLADLKRLKREAEAAWAARR